MLDCDLLAGDVIFFMDACDMPQHVAIYAGMRAGTHFITHAVTDPYNAIMTTRLKHDDFPYQVYRCRNFALATQAALRLRIWSEHQIPFSQEKHQLHVDICDSAGYSHPKTGGIRQSEYAEKYFAANFYRYIEYAAHPSSPFFPHKKLAMPGMYCSEAITAAFNVENLLLIDAVKSCEELHTAWVSDAVEPDLLPQFLGNIVPSTRYQAYVQSSHRENTYTIGRLPSNNNRPRENFPPSLVAWRHQKYGSIESFVDTYNDFYLPLDSILATPRAMMAYFENHREKWEPRGKLIVAEKYYPLSNLEADKHKWQEYIAALFEDAKAKQHMIWAHCKEESLLKKENFQLSPQHPQLKRTRSYGDLNELLITDAEKLQTTAEETQYKKALVFTSPVKKSNPPSPANLDVPKSRSVRKLDCSDEDKGVETKFSELGI